MKTWIPLGLSLAAAVIAISSFLRQEPRDEAPAIARSRATDVDGLRARLDEIEARLGALEARAERPTPARPGAPAGATTPPPAPVPGPRPEEGRDLAKALSSYDGFEEAVVGVIERDRLRREEEARLRAEERRREWEELGKGPYGQYNMKVNSLAKALNMSQAQKDSYYQLLTQYAERFSELAKGTDWRDPQSVMSYQEKQKALQEEFDVDVVRLLSPEQSEDYLKLPSWQRQPTGGAVVTSFGTADRPSSVEVRIGGPGG